MSKVDGSERLARNGGPPEVPRNSSSVRPGEPGDDVL
jgi:hypothetical protein